MLPANLLKTWKLWWRISRPHFWLYLTGPYVVGYAAGAVDMRSFLAPDFFLWLLFFTWPANLWLYGIHDLHEDGSGIKVRHQIKGRLWLGLILVASLATIGLLHIDGSGMWWLVAFLMMTTFYHVPPIRLKNWPIIDALSNGSYLLPGFLGYWLVSGMLPTWDYILAAWCWCGAMHIYSAIRDIEVDANAGLQTTAVWLGRRQSLLVCGVLWSVSTILAWDILGIIGACAVVYPLIPWILLRQPHEQISRVHSYLPLLNATMGGVLFWLSIWQ